MTDIADVRPGDKVRAVFKDERGRNVLVEGEATAYSSGLFLFGICLHYSDGTRGRTLVSFEVLEPAPPPEPDDDTIVIDRYDTTWRKHPGGGWSGRPGNSYTWQGTWQGVKWSSLLNNKPLDLYVFKERVEP